MANCKAVYSSNWKTRPEALVTLWYDVSIQWRSMIGVQFLWENFGGHTIAQHERRVVSVVPKDQVGQWAQCWIISGGGWVVSLPAPKCPESTWFLSLLHNLDFSCTYKLGSPWGLLRSFPFVQGIQIIDHCFACHIGLFTGRNQSNLDKWHLKKVRLSLSTIVSLSISDPQD